MKQQVEWSRLQNVEDTIRGAEKNTTCLFSGCEGTAIGSHVIARRTLKLIADKNHVLTWLPRKITVWDMMRSISNSLPMEQLYEEPMLVGTRDKNRVTEPLFCSIHDNTIFASLEHEGFSFKPEQVLLLAFRALFSMLYSISRIEAIYTALMKQHGNQNELRKLVVSPDRY